MAVDPVKDDLVGRALLANIMTIKTVILQVK